MADNREKPTKPYPSYPLTAHPNGQWCKKIRGKAHFFGVWADPDGALRRSHAQAGDLHEGRLPRASRIVRGGLAVKETCNEYLNCQRKKLKAGEIGDLWFGECRTMVKAFATAMGKERLVSDLTPEDCGPFFAGWHRAGQIEWPTGRFPPTLRLVRGLRRPCRRRLGRRISASA